MIRYEDLVDDCAACGGYGRETNDRGLNVGPCPHCVEGRTPSPTGQVVLIFMARFGNERWYNRVLGQ